MVHVREYGEEGLTVLRHLSFLFVKISSLECKVEELQESEQGTSEEEAQQIRNTLETTVSMLIHVHVPN